MTKKNRRLANRSGKMPCDICGIPEIREEHHIDGRDIPKPNHPSNIANICPNCHTKVHMGRIIIEGWLQTTSGLQLFWHQMDEDSVTGRESNPYIVGE